MKPEAVIFDAYGTLFDIHSVVKNVSEISGDLRALSGLWRRKQVEHTWRRALMECYVDFWHVTDDALGSAAAELGIKLTTEQFAGLMEAYLAPAVFADVRTALNELGAIPLAILSNGSPAMLEAAVRRNRLDGTFAHVISVEDVKTYKPSPKVYALGTKALGHSAQRILFVSSNAWDAAGAKAFGYTVCWCNRSREPKDSLGFDPDFLVEHLGEIVDLIAR